MPGGKSARIGLVLRIFGSAVLPLGLAHGSTLCYWLPWEAERPAPDACYGVTDRLAGNGVLVDLAGSGFGGVPSGHRAGGGGGGAGRPPQRIPPLHRWPRVPAVACVAAGSRSACPTSLHGLWRALWISCRAGWD